MNHEASFLKAGARWRLTLATLLVATLRLGSRAYAAETIEGRVPGAETPLLAVRHSLAPVEGGALSICAYLRL